jgi:membrane-bound inhibitor of C-type lysozyme
MKKYFTCVLFFLSSALLSAKAHELTVTLSEPIIYLSQDNKTFIARYGALSDDSLSFIKVTLPNGIEKTLPRAISASGARYADGRELEWWEHKGEVCVTKRDNATQNWLKCYWQLNQKPTVTR